MDSSFIPFFRTLQKVLLLAWITTQVGKMLPGTWVSNDFGGLGNTNPLEELRAARCSYHAALKRRIVAHKTRTKFRLKFVRNISTQMTLSSSAHQFRSGI